MLHWTLAVVTGFGAYFTQAGPVPAPSPYVIVSGPSYEGAIIPAALLPAWFKGRSPDSDFWTPTASEVANVERELLVYLERPSNRQISVGGGPDPADALQLGASLGMYKRQYFGVAASDRRRVLVRGLWDDNTTDWRSHVDGIIDGGCSVWWFDFDVQDQRGLDFYCQGRG